MTNDYQQHMLNIEYGCMDWIPKNLRRMNKNKELQERKEIEHLLNN